MENKYEELIKACREGHLYDFITNNGYRFTKEEIIKIIKNLDYSIYDKLGEEQTTKIERVLLESLLDDDEDFFGEDMTADEKAYVRYLSGNYTYVDYIRVCEQEDIKQPRPRK